MPDNASIESRNPTPTERMSTDRLDRRAARTRTAVLQAFFELVCERRYEELRVDDLVAKAGIGRSTFYAHFDSKDGVLAASIARPFTILANTLRETEPSALAALLEHFRDHRALARAVLGGSLRRRMVAVLADRIEPILAEGGPWQRGPLILPRRLAALQLAELLLGPIPAWLDGVAGCSGATLASAMQRIGHAALRAMHEPATPPPR